MSSQGQVSEFPANAIAREPLFARNPLPSVLPAIHEAGGIFANEANGVTGSEDFHDNELVTAQLLDPDGNFIIVGRGTDIESDFECAQASKYAASWYLRFSGNSRPRFRLRGKRKCHDASANGRISGKDSTALSYVGYLCILPYPLCISYPSLSLSLSLSLLYFLYKSRGDAIFSIGLAREYISR